MTKERLGKYIQEYSVKNKKDLGYPVYSVTNSKGFCTEYFNKDVSGANKTTYKIVPRGFFAYNPSRINVGSIDWQNCEDNVIVSPLYVVFKCSDGLNQDYLKYFLKSDCGKRQINARVSGAVRNNLKFSVLSNFELEIGSIDKQQAVVKVLKRIEEALNHEIEQLRLFDELVKSQFVELFGLPEFNTKAFPSKTIGDLSDDVRYGTSLPAVNGGTYKYLRMNNITSDGRLDLSDIKYIDISEGELEKCKVKKGDVLFNRTNSVDLIGKTTCFQEDEEMIIAGYIIRVRLKKDLNPLYLSAYMNLDSTKRLLRKMAKGAVNQANINAQELKSIRILVPPLNLQNEFVTFLNKIEKSRIETQKRINLYKELLSKKTDELFNGESA